MPASGTGDNGVLLIGEAAGEHEALQGEGFVGKAGEYLFSQLKRIGIDREGFRIANVLSCRPPDNILAKASYEAEAIATCSPLLDATIDAHIVHCSAVHKTPVIVALGRIAFKRIMGLGERSPLMGEDYLSYVHWSEHYGCWTLACDHPSYLLRGNHHLTPVLCNTIAKAMEIAKDRFSYDNPTYILDPEPAVFQQWVLDYQRVLKSNPDTFLSYDIETPYKKGKSEDAISSADDESFIILRCSFAYDTSSAISVPWKGDYIPILERLFTTEGGTIFGWNNNGYDDERVIAQMPIRGTIIDAMTAWHVLNSTLPKALGYVTPFYWREAPMWKHLSHSSPALYNAIDALAALRCWLGIREGLKETGLWPVFDRHVLQLNKALSYMSQKGLMRDEIMRDEVEAKLTTMLGEIDTSIQAAVPMEARHVKLYKKTPKSIDGLVQVAVCGVVRRCSNCGSCSPTKPHFKPTSKRSKKPDNPCSAASVVSVEEMVQLYGKLLPWKISLKGLLSYQRVKGHTAFRGRRSKRITFDKNAMKRLMKAHPSDALYPLIGQHHHLGKLLGTYVGRHQKSGRIKGGMPMGSDGLGHPTFKHDPSTLRLSCPFFHTLPRTGKPDDPHTWIRDMIIARPGHILHARDFSGIEGVLVGYEAKSPAYIRLALKDVHSFYTAYALNQLDGRVKANDLPLLSWSDEKLFTRLAEIKAEFKHDRNSLYKHLVHASNFGQGPAGAVEKIYSETNVLYPVPLVGKVMSIYKELFPEIPKWHDAVRWEAHDKGYLTNAFGYVHRFSHIFRWVRENGKWVRKLGDEAEAALAFRPQSNAAGIIKESIIRLYFDRFEEAGQYLRLQIHDENMLEVPIGELEKVAHILQEEMERPILQLPMPPEWGLGPYLRINTEAKTGARWGEMK